jgi:catechol 2,3-dioxygenase-like lactoylglutathione lyase family enzyme
MSEADGGAPPGVGRLTGVSHTGFTVADIERSIAFYEGLLGMTLLRRQEGARPYLSAITGFPDVYLKTAFLKVSPESAHVLELLEYVSHPGEPTPRETNRPGNGHLCFVVEDIQALHARLSAAGVTFIAPPTEITSGINQGVVGCYLRDPDGFTIELMQLPARPAGGEPSA